MDLLMSRRNVDLPPLNCLQTFEAAARHLSFTQAAHELNLTQSAVSRQVKRLEEDLARPLFYRLAQGLSLTPASTVSTYPITRRKSPWKAQPSA
jgi:biotin operon repressor